MLWLFIWMFYQKQRGLTDCIHCLAPRSPKRKQQNFRSFPPNTQSFVFHAAFDIRLKIVSIFQKALGLQWEKRCDRESGPILMFDCQQLSNPFPTPAPSAPWLGQLTRKHRCLRLTPVGSSNHTSSGTHVEIFTSACLLIRVKAKLVSIPSSLKPTLGLFRSLPCSP